LEKGCVHHHKIEPPNGPESLGECKKCGDRRMFSNREVWPPYKGPRVKKVKA